MAADARLQGKVALITGATKGAMNALTRSMTVEYAPRLAS